MNYNNIMPDDKQSPSGDSLEELKKRLYKKEEKFGGRYREPEFSYRPEQVERDWKPIPKQEKTSLILELVSRIPRYVFVSVGAVFLLVIIALIYIFGGVGVISSRNVDLDLSGPQTIKGGELASWEVVVRNRNDVPLESAYLIFDYPDNSEPIVDLGRSFLQERRSLGVVQPNEVVRETFEAFMFGKEGDTGEVKVAFEYRAQGSNAILAKEDKLSIEVLSSPVAVAIKMPEEVGDGQEVDIDIEYNSNADSVLRDLVLQMSFPEGLEFIEASPAPLQGRLEWDIGQLKPGEKGAINIKAVARGRELEAKSVHASLGTLEDGDLRTYGGGVATFAVRKPFLVLDILAEGEQSPIFRPGETVNVRGRWKNNMPVDVSDVIIEITLKGNAIDERGIAVEKGFYRGLDRKITWNPSSLGELKTLKPGEEGIVEFEFKVVDVPPAQIGEGEGLLASLEGKIRSVHPPVGYEGVDISGTDVLGGKIQTKLQLVQKVVYNSSILPGSGPLPPKVGQETVYTVVWSLANSFNDLRDVVVKTSLPSYVNWKNAVIPASANIIFDAERGEIIWGLGELAAGAGLREPAKEVTFQIGLLASADQIGSTPVLLLETVAEGVDVFTNRLIRDIEGPANTDLKDDPSVFSRQGEVQP